MITLVVSRKGGPMLLSLSGWLVGSGGGKSGIGTSSHLSRFAWQRHSPRHYRATENSWTQAIALMFSRWYTRRDPGEEVWCVIIMTIRLRQHETWAYGPYGPKARASSKERLASWSVLLGQSPRPNWAKGSKCRTQPLMQFNRSVTKINATLQFLDILFTCPHNA